MKIAGWVAGLFVAAVLIFLLLIAFPAKATPVMACDRADAIIAALKAQHHETLAVQGITGDGTGIMQIYTSESGTYTMLQVQPGGWACVVGAGTDFEKFVQGQKI